MIENIKNLTTDDDRNFYINKEKLKDLKKELEDFLKEEQKMKTIDFSKNVMHSQEIKTNNTIEGYFDDVSLIENVINNHKDTKNINQKNRIINLYKGYQYILNKKEINKETLKELYSILSKDLLIKYDIEHMGKYYREDEVFIYYSDNPLVSPDKGIDHNLLDKKMDDLFKYLNNNNDFETLTDYYIKSQIAHFYFVYLHPYFDINGRTSRTVSMWYLINNKAYPYTIFNRAINNNKNAYYREIRKVKKVHNITNFVEYMMKNTKIELEKEYILENIEDAYSTKLTPIENDAVRSILSMKNNKTLKDFSYLYNLKNDKKRVGEIYFEMIKPLLEKGIILKLRNTNSLYNGENHNFVFEINTKKLDLDKSKIKRLTIN